MIPRLFRCGAIFLLCLLTCSTLQSQSLIDYAERQKQKSVERERIERQKYEEACQKGTINALYEFQRSYPNSQYAEDIQKRIAEHTLWEKTQSLNTIEAYQSYINNATYNYHTTDAQNAIDELRARDAWETLKTTTSIAELDAFTRAFPKTSVYPQAYRRLHELKGVKYAQDHFLIAGYKEFALAGGKYNLDPQHWTLFDQCKEAYDYENISTYEHYRNPDTLLAFLRNYSQSAHYDKVSNMLAIAKAKRLTLSSGSYEYNQALKYATREETRQTVNAYIAANQKAIKKHKKQQHWDRHNAHGRLVQFGLEVIDIAFDPSYALGPEDNDFTYYNFGLSLKIGNYKDPVQWEIGIKPGVYLYNTFYTRAGFQLPAYSRLKVNLFSTGRSSKFYFDVAGYYNIFGRRCDTKGFDWAASAGLGFAWRRMDWSFYYKMGLDFQDILEHDYVGTSLRVYLYRNK